MRLPPSPSPHDFVSEVSDSVSRLRLLVHAPFISLNAD
jgi:hypothetical protein